MNPKTPKSITHGHINLCEELETIIKNGGQIAEQTKILEKIMMEHFVKEEKFALPPLGLLVALSEGNWKIDEQTTINMAEVLSANLDELKEDHKNISKLVEKIKILADKENDVDAKRFVNNITVHVELEDQVLYPTVILIGNYLKHFGKHSP